MIRPSNRASIRNISDYSPFGVQLSERTISGDGYRFGFQGQEGDDEIKGEGNSVNYKYRMHDPRIGRFFVIDPLTSDYPHNSPFAFSENVVINAVELEGLERHYIFNSAYLSAQALSAISKQSYKEIKSNLDGLVGTNFNTPENLKFAKSKLGKKFDSSAGYASDGTVGLSSGNHAVRGGYESNNCTANHFSVRFVIDNGNGTWSEKNVFIFNYKSKFNGLAKSIEDIDRKIAERIPQIAEEEAERQQDISDGDNDLLNSTGGFGSFSAAGKAVQLAGGLMDMAQPTLKVVYKGNDRVLRKLYNQRTKVIQKMTDLNNELNSVKKEANTANAKLIIK